MKNIIKNRVDRVKELEDKIKEHPLCFQLKLLFGTYLVELPNRMQGVYAIKCSGEETKSGQLIKLYGELEEYWKEDSLFEDVRNS